MSSIPKKLFWMLGYNNLSIILEQERRHWLLKTDKNKRIQDKLTGDMFQGQIDNIGSDVVIESQKLPYKYTITSSIKFDDDDANDVLSINNSAFPHSAAVNGLMFARIMSTNYAYGNDDINHYKIKFENAEKCILPFGASVSSDEVYADTWIKTSTVPTVMILDRNTGTYSITRPLRFTSDITNPVWYYPLSETLQPLGIVDKGHGTYEMDAVNDDGYIGYPLFWFTCDQTNVGSNLTFDSNNINLRDEQIFFISNEGNASPFNAKVYTGIDGNLDATPDGTSTANYIIKCTAKFDNPFSGNASDFEKALDPNGISLVNTISNVATSIEFICGSGDKITMDIDAPWEYDSSNDVYTIDMSYFDQNCIQAVEVTTPLVAAFRVYFDSTIPFVQQSTDVGLAGIRLGAANPNSDVYERYPYNLNKWEGLPEWLNELDSNLTPEHAVMYAFHQPPTYDPEDPESMQGAGLILDPGKHAVSDSPIQLNDEIGRVYVLSNDDIEYKNNATERYPKPARTAARICDIPTSVIQLAGTTGNSPDPIVDKKYVRTEANFSNEDLYRLYNMNSSRWVRPTALTSDGISVYEKYKTDNMFAFNTLQELEAVDMINHNDFRVWMNQNPMVDSSKVSIRQVVNGGSGYNNRDQGVCIIGGYPFIYEVQEATPIDPNTHQGGVVLSVAIIPPSEDPDPDPKMIALANFDMMEGTTGFTQDYGTSPTSGSGKGLKIALAIERNHYLSILPYRGEFFTDLFAFVREHEGAYVYEYHIDNTSRTTPKKGTWEKTLKISEYEITSYMKKNGGVSTHESFINSILPSIRELPVTMKAPALPQSNLTVSQTASFLNVIDKTKSPVVPDRSSTDPATLENIVDITKLHCDGFREATAASHTLIGVMNKVRELGAARYDCYVLWNWTKPQDSSNRDFVFGVVYRGFINQMTDDQVTMLPSTELYFDNYVHTNPGTTVAWDVPGIGTMVWVYDPSYKMKENYYINPETMELEVERVMMNYDNIDVINDDKGLTVHIIDENRNLLWNVFTNNIIKPPTDQIPIYQQIGMYQLQWTNQHKAIDNIPPEEQLCGNWRLVLPRINSYRLANDVTGTQYIPQKLDVIKASVHESDDITDPNGNVINTKCLVMDSSNGEVRFKAYNRVTRKWETI